MDIEECMYSNIKQRRLLGKIVYSIGDDKVVCGDTRCVSLESTSARNKNKEIIRKLNRTFNYEKPHRITVKYPVINNTRMHATNGNIKDNTQPDTLVQSEINIRKRKVDQRKIDEHRRIKIQTGKFSCMRNSRNSCNKTNIKACSDKMGKEKPQRQLLITPPINVVASDYNSQGTDLNSDSGINCEFSISDLQSDPDEEVKEIRPLLQMHPALPDKLKWNCNVDKVICEPLSPQKSIIKASLCTAKIQSTADIHKSNNEDDNSDSILNFSKCKHSTPQKDEKLITVSKVTMDKLYKRIMKLEEKVDKFQIHNIASDVAQAVLLIQILHHDDKRSWMENEKQTSNTKHKHSRLLHGKRLINADNNQSLMQSSENKPDPIFPPCFDLETSVKRNVSLGMVKDSEQHMQSANSSIPEKIIRLDYQF